jgi:hypothetical protein
MHALHTLTILGGEKKIGSLARVHKLEDSSLAGLSSTFFSLSSTASLFSCITRTTEELAPLLNSTVITMRTSINLSIIILALAAWAAARPTLAEQNNSGNNPSPQKGSPPSLLDRLSCYGDYSPYPTHRN